MVSERHGEVWEGFVRVHAATGSMLHVFVFVFVFMFVDTTHGYMFLDLSLLHEMILRECDIVAVCCVLGVICVAVVV